VSCRLPLLRINLRERRAACKDYFPTTSFDNKMSAQSFINSSSTDIASEHCEGPCIDTNTGLEVQDAKYTSLPTNEYTTSHQALTASLFYRITLDTWVPEALALFISAASIIAIAGILTYYNKKKSPELPYSITLNAIVSILATISRSMLIFAVSMCIGQLKWCWYHERKRKVEDIQTMVRAKTPLNASHSRDLS
jgi:hypothetical protein